MIGGHGERLELSVRKRKKGRCNQKENIINEHEASVRGCNRRNIIDEIAARETLVRRRRIKVSSG